MQHHLVLTEQCNKQCTYCGGTRHIEFFRQDPEPVIGFYGCEIIP